MGLNERQQELVSALVDEVLEGDELREAQELVSANPEAARLLEDYRGDLARMQALPVMKAEPHHRARLKPPRPTTMPRWLKAAAIVLIVGGLGLWIYYRHPGRRLLALLPAVEARVAPGQGPMVKIFSGLKGRMVAEAVTHFKMMVDGEGGHASEAHLCLRYDFDGDGSFDRTEIYALMADAAPGWQRITQDAAKLVKVEGQEMRDFTGGALQAELQCVHPETALLANIEEITLPHSLP